MRRIAKFILMGLLFALPSSLYAQGELKGRVVFEGTAPAVEKVEVKSDTPTCGSQKEVQKIVLGQDQGVANAVVIIAGAEGVPQPKDGMLDQVKCDFVPHVQVIPLRSNLKITSSDAVLHNSHGFYEDGSTAFNLAVPIVGMEVSQKMKQTGVIKLRCDAGHTWMSAYVVVTDKPYYALTDANGNFTLEGIPPGDYQIEVWQEWLGKHTEPVSIKEGEQSILLTLKAE